MIESGCKECLGCGLSRQRKFEMCAYDGGETRLQLRLEGDTVWLTQLEIAELFQTTKQNVSLHARNIFGDQEMDENSVVKESLTTAADGKKYRTKLYNQGTDPGLLARQCGQVARLSRPTGPQRRWDGKSKSDGTTCRAPVRGLRPEAKSRRSPPG